MNKNHESLDTEQPPVDALYVTIPNLSLARAHKEGYKDYPIDANNELYDEPLVNINDYGLAGQAYYSRPNAATGQAIPEVPRELYLRKTVAEKLSRINEAIDRPLLEGFFGGSVELYIEDAYRSYDLQQNLYQKVFPHLIWQQNPGITDEQLDAKLAGLIAEPSNDPAHPSPHATGGAVDVGLRYKQDTKGYVPDSLVDMGYDDADTSKRTYPDYFEHFKHVPPETPRDKHGMAHRRALYAIMTGAALGFDTELQINPTEWWHWSFGDQMWAKLQNKPAALYGLTEPNREKLR